MIDGTRAEVERFVRDVQAAESDIEIKLSFTGRKMEEFKKSIFHRSLVEASHESIVQNSKAYLGHRPKLFECVSFFRFIANRHETKLSEISLSDKMERQLRQHQNSVLEPKFLIFKRSGRLVLAICDKSIRVNQRKLQRTNEPEVFAHFADDTTLVEIGITPKQVHPMILDPFGVFSHVIVDARIFFQFTMFPNSMVLLPNYKFGEGLDKKFRITISSFIRSLQQAFSQDILVFSDIALKSKHSETQVELIGEHASFSRFAPTPSGTLHIGNARTALISKLFSMPNHQKSDFHVRFDDTNVDEKDAAQNKLEISQSLEWLGISPKRTYSQSDPERQPLYRAALDLMISTDFAKRYSDGTVELNIDAIKNRYSFFFDFLRGPVLRHGIPKTDSRGNKLDYTLYWPDRDLYKYKFAGIIDDLLNSSVVIRDSRQLDSLFTARQSIIAQALREARDECRARSLSRQLDSFESAIEKYRPRRMAATPLFCTPVYLHVARVQNSDGKIISKSKGNSDVSLRSIMLNGSLFPETIVAWIFRSLGSRFSQSLGYSSDIKETSKDYRLGWTDRYAVV